MTDQEQRWMELGKAIERACAELPEGYELSIGLERGAGTPMLIHPDGESVGDFDGDTFADHINSAIDYANGIAAIFGD